MKAKRFYAVLVTITILFSFTTNLTCFAATTNESQVHTSLNVALYGYVPDTQRFENAVRTAWRSVEPNVDLNFVDWDCYGNDPTKDLDVFVFDSIYLQHYVNEGYLLPMPENRIDNKDDLLDFALSGCTMNGTIYAIPQIICTNLLYYRNDDTQMANVNTITELYQLLGDRESDSIIPGQNEGLLFDMSGGTSNVCLYLDALIDQTQAYTNYAQLPTYFDDQVVSYLKMLQSMAGTAQANYWPDDDDAYVRAKWLADGKGRAYLGYTEAMSSMGNFANDVNFKTISYSQYNNIPLFYGDVIGINSYISACKKDLAIELVNTIAASDTMVTALSPDEDNLYPQYLLPARSSVYETMSDAYPIYGKLREIAVNPDNKLFLLGPDVELWLSNVKDILGEMLNEEQEAIFTAFKKAA
ncbi:MAG: thiamine pyridinylase [Anaerocolumna sp.]